MKIHPDVLSAHAQFGGDLESMQRLYDSYDHAAEITTLRKELAEARAELDVLENDIQSKALWLRGEQAYREFPGFVINRIRDAKKAIALRPPSKAKGEKK